MHFMKPFLLIILVFIMFDAVAQTTAIQQPIEEQYHISYLWWIIGVIIAIAAGIGLYMLIKKNPRKDAV